MMGARISSSSFPTLGLSLKLHRKLCPGSALETSGGGHAACIGIVHTKLRFFKARCTTSFPANKVPPFFDVLLVQKVNLKRPESPHFDLGIVAPLKMRVSSWLS